MVVPLLPKIDHFSSNKKEEENPHKERTGYLCGRKLQRQTDTAVGS